MQDQFSYFISGCDMQLPPEESAMTRSGKSSTADDDPISVAKKCYKAYIEKDRAAIERVIADDFHFSSPLDNRIDR